MRRNFVWVNARNSFWPQIFSRESVELPARECCLREMQKMILK